MSRLPPAMPTSSLVSAKPRAEMFSTPMIAPAAPPIISSSRPALPVLTKLATSELKDSRSPP